MKKCARPLYCSSGTVAGSSLSSCKIANVSFIIIGVIFVDPSEN